MLRPIDSLFKDSFMLMIRNWLPLLCTQLGVMFATTIVVIIVGLALFMPLVFKLISFAFTTQFTKTEVISLLTQFFTGPFWIFLVVVFIVGVAFRAWANVAMVAAVGYKGEGGAQIGDVFKKGFQRFWGAFFLVFFIYFVFYGGLLLLIVPCIIVLLALSLSWYIYVLEDASFGVAMATSWKMTRGFRWAILGRWILAVLAIILVEFVLAFLGVIPFVGILIVPAQLAVHIAILPFFIAFGYCIFDDIKRSKGLELSRPGGGFIVGMTALGLFSVATVIGVVFLIFYFIRHLPS